MDRPESRVWPGPYVGLAEAMTALRVRYAGTALLGASLVHPRHSIPAEQLRLLADIRGNVPIQIPSSLHLIKKAAVCLASAVVDSFVFFCLRLRFAAHSSAIGNESFDVIMKTWAPGAQALSKPADFYYGTLLDQLKSQRLKALMLAGDGKSDDGSLFSKLRSLLTMFQFARTALVEFNVRYFPETLLVPPLAPLRAFFSQCALAFKLRSDAGRIKEQTILKRMTAQAALDVLRPYTTKNLMHAHIARNVVERWKPKAVLTFYEGQPWEKVFWGAVKETNPSVKLIGYQHTVVMPHSFALTRPVRVPGEVPAPDLVLCTGDFTRKNLSRAHETMGTKFITLGSYRRAPGAAHLNPPRPDGKTVLVLPEGILTEAILLFDGAMELARRLPDHKFIFRCHPVLPFEKVQPHLKNALSDCPTVNLSIDPQIQNDFLRSSALIYRGSSAVLYAVLAGVKPYCWLDAAAPNVDPLSALTGWRQSVMSLDQLEHELKSYAKATASLLEPDWRPAAEQVDQMAVAVSDAAIAALAREVL